MHCAACAVSGYRCRAARKGVPTVCSPGAVCAQAHEAALAQLHSEKRALEKELEHVIDSGSRCADELRTSVR